MVFELFLLLLSLSFILLFFYLLLIAVYGRDKVPYKAQPGPFPRVTIFKPMKNIDDGLEDNLASFFTLDYPAYDMIFGVDTASDACVAVIEKMGKRYPSVAVSIVETGASHAVNPKIDKLSKMSAGCDSLLFWVADSNVRVDKDTLARLVLEYIKEGSKIVFSPIKGAGGGTMGSIMAGSYLNLFVSGNIIGAWKLMRKPIIVGKSMLIERKALESLGGFSAFDCYLAEDYMMGYIYIEKGLSVSTNCTWVTNYSSTTSVGTFYSRMSRWAKMRLRIDPFFYCLEICSNPLAIAFCSVFFLGAKGAALLAAVYILKLAVECVSFLLTGGAARGETKNLAAYPLCVPVKDAILFAVYVTSFFSKTVDWHGRKISIGSLSRINSRTGGKIIDEKF